MTCTIRCTFIELDLTLRILNELHQYLGTVNNIMSKLKN